MRHSDADTERTRLASATTLPPGFPPPAGYVQIFTRVRPDVPSVSEVVGARLVTRTATYTVKGVGGGPDTIQTVSETVRVYDTLAH